MTKRIALFCLLLQLAVPPACRDEVSVEDDDADTGADTDADSDTDSDTDTDGGWCGDGLDGDCPEGWGELTPLLEASSLEGEVRFSALSEIGRAILAERTTGDVTTPLVIVGDSLFGDVGLADPELPPAEPLTPVAISATESALLPLHVALLCSETACALWGTDVEHGETGLLSPVAGGEVPSSMSEARGLTRIPGDITQLCVFGDGIACFDGETWTTEVEPGSGPPFNDVELVGYDDRPFAVGDEGRILRRTETGWVAEESGTDEALVGVASGWGDVLAIVGAEGTLIVGTSEPSTWQSCLASDTPMLGLAWTVTDSPITNWLELLTTAGTVLRVDEDGDTCAVAGDLLGTPVAITGGAAGTCWDTRALTEQALYHKIVDCTE